MILYPNAALVPQILLGNDLNSDLVIYRRARKVAVRSQPHMWFNVDGELVGTGPATLDVVPLALDVSVGTDAA